MTNVVKRCIHLSKTCISNFLSYWMLNRSWVCSELHTGLQLTNAFVRMNFLIMF